MSSLRDRMAALFAGQRECYSEGCDQCLEFLGIVSLDADARAPTALLGSDQVVGVAVGKELAARVEEPPSHLREHQRVREVIRVERRVSHGVETELLVQRVRALRPL